MTWSDTKVASLSGLTVIAAPCSAGGLFWSFRLCHRIVYMYLVLHWSLEHPCSYPKASTTSAPPSSLAWQHLLRGKKTNCRRLIKCIFSWVIILKQFTRFSQISRICLHLSCVFFSPQSLTFPYTGRELTAERGFRSTGYACVCKRTSLRARLCMHAQPHWQRICGIIQLNRCQIVDSLLGARAVVENGGENFLYTFNIGKAAAESLLSFSGNVFGPLSPTAI